MADPVKEKLEKETDAFLELVRILNTIPEQNRSRIIRSLQVFFDS